MSCIAYRDGIMAADRQAWLGRGEPFHARKTKIHRVDGWGLVGISSSIVGAPTALLGWLDAGASPDIAPALTNDNVNPDWSMLAVSPAGVLTIWQDNFFATTFEATWIAIGSGSEYALGAMVAGASAENAVRAAMICDAFTAPGAVDVLYLDGE